MAKKGNNILKGWGDLQVTQLLKAPWNYKGESSKLSSKLLNGLKENGQIETMLVRWIENTDGIDYYEVANGNHRLDQLNAAGIDAVHVFSLGECSLNKAKKLAILLNETRFKPDEIKLAETIRDLLGEEHHDILAQTLPFDANEMLDMKNMLDFDWSQFSGKAPKMAKNRHQVITFELSEEQYQKWRTCLEIMNTTEKTKSETHAFINLVESRISKG